MKIKLALVLLLLAAPAGLRAEDTRPGERAVQPEVVRTLDSADAPAQPEMILTEMKVAERAVSSDAAVAQDMPQRGSFWWLVGVIVVAGVILYLVLD